MYEYKTRGTCTHTIKFEVQDNKLTHIELIGGCPGNTQGVARLAKGRDIDELIGLIDGIQCGSRGTSCPDQLAKALKAYKEQSKNS